MKEKCGENPGKPVTALGRIFPYYVINGRVLSRHHVDFYRPTTMDQTEAKKILQDLAKREDLKNKVCSDCSNPNPQWASLRFYY